jgi:branched-chain amino acid transport system substrate-binding protein
VRFIRPAMALGSVALLAAVAGCDFSGVSATPEKGDIVIGADLELSGADASVGTAYQRALQLKVDQINAGGLLGKRKVTLDIRDNRSDSTLSLTNIGEFANNSSVAALITGACTECVAKAAKTIADKQLPTISLSPAANVTNPVADHKYLFKLGPNPSDDAAILANELRLANVRKVGLLTTDDQYGQDGRAAMTNEMDAPTIKNGLQLAAQQTFKPTDTDVSQAVREVVDKQPDAIVVWAFADQAQLVATSARAAGFKGTLYFDAAAAGDLFLPGNANAATNGATMVFTQTMAIDDVIATTPAKAARRQWFQDYTARYGSYYGMASFAADALDLLTQVINKVGDTDRSAMRAVLESTQIDGLSGPIRITPDNHSGLRPQGLVLLVASSGRWRLKA